MKTDTIYECGNCGHKSRDVDEIDLGEWASFQDPADTCGIPAGCCESCAAPVYEPGTFRKIDAARAMLAALRKSVEWIADAQRNGCPAGVVAVPSQIADAITAAEAAGITPAED